MAELLSTRPLRPSGGGTPGRQPALRIRIVRGPGEGTTFNVDRPRVVIGRSKAADVQIADATVSAFHVELSPTEQGIRVLDRSSTNGVSVGGIKIVEAIVPSGAALQLGAAVVVVEYGADYELPTLDVMKYGPLVGGSLAMRRLYAVLDRLAPTDLSVLIEGETGTGKQLAAQVLHERAGGRGEVPVLDCAAIPHDLADSVLFGHVKGAFTGAKESQIGVFELASGGALFIDEIGEFPLDLQPKLLRVLQEGQIKPVGAKEYRRVDVRVISATWRDLRSMVNSGTFREDLYQRMVGVTIRMPSLSERIEDIPWLVEHFLTYCAPPGQSPKGISDDVLASIASRPFVGNVRELRTAVQRLSKISRGPTITMDDLAFDRYLTTCSTRPGAPATLESGVKRAAYDVPFGPLKESRRSCAEEFEKTYLRRLMEQTQGNLTRAAALAGVERHSLRELLRKHDLYSKPSGSESSSNNEA